MEHENWFEYKGNVLNRNKAMLQYYDDPDKRFRALMDNVSSQIKSTNFSDAKIAEICFTSAEFVRRQRKFLSLRLLYAHLIEDNEMPNKIQIPYDDLYREYVENEKNVEECAEFFGHSRQIILRSMKEHGIQARPRGTRKKGNSVTGDPEIITTSESAKKLKELTEAPKISPKRRPLERLMFLSAIKGDSIQELLEEALELLFEKYGEET